MTQGLQLSRQNATEPVLGIYTSRGGVFHPSAPL